MTVEDFRRMALSFREAREAAHMGHPDFRVGGKIFATLSYPDERWAMVRLTGEQQRALVEAEPKVFVVVKGAWGRQGATNVRLRPAKRATVRGALEAAWRNRAPKRLAEQYAEGR